jgi:hypothetical protein
LKKPPPTEGGGFLNNEEKNMETLETMREIRERLRTADAAQDVEAANQAALAYEESRFSLAAVAAQVTARVRQPYFVQTA